MEADWRPGAPLRTLRQRARILERVRAFFAQRGLWEVETPALSFAAATDPHIDSFRTCYRGPQASGDGVLYLHTSPEFPMKRLLAAGSGPIFQIARVFRDGEAGRLHNPEFTLVEWYRPGFGVDALMDEVAELVKTALERELPTRQISYREAFESVLNLDPHHAPVDELRRAAADIGLSADLGEERDDWLDLLLSHRIEPAFDPETLTFLHSYPVSQAALAQLRDGDPAVAERFELYYRGMELANGFHELADAAEQERRFRADLVRRRAAGKPVVPMDSRLLGALRSGLPDCSGVALGLDRLVMCALEASHIGEVLAFPVQLA